MIVTNKTIAPMYLEKLTGALTEFRPSSYIIEDGEIIIDVYVIVEYGIRIRSVAESVQHTVQFHVEKALGLPVRAVNVYIQGLRLEKEKEKEKVKSSKKEA